MAKINMEFNTVNSETATNDLIDNMLIQFSQAIAAGQLYGEERAAIRSTLEYLFSGYHIRAKLDEELEREV